MNRRSAILACLMAWVGQPIAAQNPTTPEEGTGFSSSGSAVPPTNIAALISDSYPTIMVTLDAKGIKGIPKIIVSNAGKEQITISADEIWCALNDSCPPKVILNGAK